MKYILYILLAVSIVAWVSYQLSSVFEESFVLSFSNNLTIGFIFLGVIILLELVTRKNNTRSISAVLFGLLAGLVLSSLSVNFLSVFLGEYYYWVLIKAIITLIFCYLGVFVAVKAKDEFNLAIPYIKLVGKDKSKQVILIDTSVIIDGRISDIIDTGFIDEKFIIPRFILNELQQIADSKDSMKRKRGRRGLDVLNKIKSNTNIQVSIQDQDFPEIKEVDSKLIKLAKILDSKILTNDYNLNKVAELQGIKILNINELANALKPVVLPGENMHVKLVKRGKEKSQALAYLKDGTMIVVDDSKHLIGKDVDVEVTSVLQTSAGKMIFAMLSDN